MWCSDFRYVIIIIAFSPNTYDRLKTTESVSPHTLYFCQLASRWVLQILGSSNNDEVDFSNEIKIELLASLSLELHDNIWIYYAIKKYYFQLIHKSTYMNRETNGICVVHKTSQKK